MEKYRRSKTADDLQQIPLNLPPDHIYCQSTGKVQSYIGSALSKLQVRISEKPSKYQRNVDLIVNGRNLGAL